MKSHDSDDSPVPAKIWANFRKGAIINVHYYYYIIILKLCVKMLYVQGLFNIESNFSKVIIIIIIIIIITIIILRIYIAPSINKIKWSQGALHGYKNTNSKCKKYYKK